MWLRHEIVPRVRHSVESECDGRGIMAACVDKEQTMMPRQGGFDEKYCGSTRCVDVDVSGGIDCDGVRERFH